MVWPRFRRTVAPLSRTRTTIFGFACFCSSLAADFSAVAFSAASLSAEVLSWGASAFAGLACLAVSVFACAFVSPCADFAGSDFVSACADFAASDFASATVAAGFAASDFTSGLGATAPLATAWLSDACSLAVLSVLAAGLSAAAVFAAARTGAFATSPVPWTLSGAVFGAVLGATMGARTLAVFSTASGRAGTSFRFALLAARSAARSGRAGSSVLGFCTASGFCALLNRTRAAPRTITAAMRPRIVLFTEVILCIPKNEGHRRKKQGRKKAGTEGTKKGAFFWQGEAKPLLCTLRHTGRATVTKPCK